MKTYVLRSVKRVVTVTGLLALILLVGQSHRNLPALAQEMPTTAFVNVNVIPMDTERVLEDQVVIIENGLITAVSPADAVSIPNGAEIIDGQDGYLMPGLADMHMHIETNSANNDPKQMLFFLAQGTTTIRALGTGPKAYPWREQVARGDLVGPTFYVMGRSIIGNYRDEFGLSLIMTIFSILRLVLPLLMGAIVYLLFKRVRTRQTLIVGSGTLLIIGLILMVTKTPAFMILGPAFDRPDAFVAENVGQVKSEVVRQRGWDVDGVKLYDGLTEEMYLAGVREAHNQGLYATGHLLNHSSLAIQLASGIDEIAHVDEFLSHHWVGYNGGEDPDSTYTENFDFPVNYETIAQTVALVAENDIVVVSNMSTDEIMFKMIFDTEGTLAAAEYAAADPRFVEAWRTEGRHKTIFANTGEYRRDVVQPFLTVLIKALHDADVTIILGTDTGGFAPEGSVANHIHREVELLVEAGFSNYEALAAGTKNAGMIVERMGRNGNFGTVAIGQRADLILISDNPLENVSATRDRSGVMAQGRWYTQAELDKMVAAHVASLRP